MRFKFLLSEDSLSLEVEDLLIQDKLLELLLVLKEHFQMEWTGMHIIHMDSQTECNIVAPTMLQIWLML